MAERFFTSDPITIGELTLTGAEAHHLAGVRRIGVGARVVLFNGNGCEYEADVTAIGKKNVTLHVDGEQAIDRELPFPLIVAAALPKGDRADFLVEKLTELGATRFIPLVTARSVVVPKPTFVEKAARMVIEASKQCGRNRLMAIDAPRRWVELLSLADLPATRLILHPASGSPWPPSTRSGAVVAIGPEGGFSPEEVDAAAAAGWRAVVLGRRILRVETAALAAAARIAGESEGSQ